MLWLLLILVVIGVVIYRADKKLKERFQDKFNPSDWDLPVDTVTPAAVAPAPVAPAKPIVNLRFEKNPQVFSVPEQQLFFTLQTALGEAYVIFARLPLAAVVSVRPLSEARELADLQLDFVICDKDNLDVLCALTIGANERLAAICEPIQMPLVQLARQQEYDAQPIREQLLAILAKENANEQAGQEMRELRKSDEPVALQLCPKCASVMLKRTAKSGSQAGKVFWACANYPTCKGLIAAE